MKLVVLSDAKAMDGYGSEHGLSFLLELDDQLSLFDTGASDLFLRNARKLNLDLNQVDRIVLSHGHYDHGNGLQFLQALPLVCHPGCFVKRYRKKGKGGPGLGLALSPEEIKSKFELRASKEAIKLSDHLYFLGEVPKSNDFEARCSTYVLEGGEEDPIMDDSGLACLSDQGLIVISGCAHSGICNMTNHAREVTGVDRVAAVLGGFHLSSVNRQAQKTIQFLKDLGVNQVLPSHCTLEPVRKAFQDHFQGRDLLVGGRLYF